VNHADEAYAMTLKAREDVIPVVVNGAVNKLMLKVKEQAKLGSFQATLQVEFDNPADVVQAALPHIIKQIEDRKFFIKTGHVQELPWDAQDRKPTVVFCLGWEKEHA